MAKIIPFLKPNERDRKRCNVLMDFVNEINKVGMSASSWLSLESFIRDLNREFTDENCKQQVLVCISRIDEMIDQHIKDLGDKKND